jgi:hypothetical protein
MKIEDIINQINIENRRGFYLNRPYIFHNTSVINDKMYIGFVHHPMRMKDPSYIGIILTKKDEYIKYH